MKILFLYILSLCLILTNACSITSKLPNTKVEIEEMWVYNDFVIRGFTTAGAYTHFDDLKKNGTDTTMIAETDKIKLEQILNVAQYHKHYQTKLGISNVFCEIKFKGVNSHRLVITGLDTTYNLGKSATFIDLTAMTSYMVTNPEELGWIQNFIIEIRKQEK